MADIEVSIDGEPYVANAHKVYKDCMMSDVPNFVFCRGYFQASWTLKVDLTCKFLCRLLHHMRDVAIASVCPRVPPEGVGEPPELQLSSGYVKRMQDRFPTYGAADPWLPLLSYNADKKVLCEGPVLDKFLEVVVADTGRAEPLKPAAVGSAPRSRL